MAHCLRRPVVSAASFSFSARLQQRSFSARPAQWAKSPASRNKPQYPKAPSERSFKIVAKEMTMFPNDVGMLQETFVAPSISNQPSLFQHPLQLLRLHWERLKRKPRDALALAIYKFSNKPRLVLRWRQTAPAAVALHRQMYAAFAEGDLATLKKICADGLYEDFRARIQSRPKGEVWEWEVVRYRRRPRVMSHRAASLGREGMGLRQAVVRIASRQKLSRRRPDGTLVGGSGKEKNTVEYLVTQRRMTKGVEAEWMVWGTTEETTLEKLQNERRMLYGSV